MSDQRERYAELGFGNARVGLGTRPAVLVVDLQRGFLEDGLGTDHSAATLATTARVLDTARQLALPVFYVRVVHESEEAAGIIWREKVPAVAACVRGDWRTEIHPDVAPGPHDRVLDKQWASAFFGTSLHEELTALGVDALIVTGTSTGGCVRASVVDAAQHDYRVTVVADAVEDRNQTTHETCLVDFDAKYADVRTADDLLAALTDAAAD